MRTGWKSQNIWRKDGKFVHRNCEQVQKRVLGQNAIDTILLEPNSASRRAYHSNGMTARKENRSPNTKTETLKISKRRLGPFRKGGAR